MSGETMNSLDIILLVMLGGRFVFTLLNVTSHKGYASTNIFLITIWGREKICPAAVTVNPICLGYAPRKSRNNT